MKLLAMMGLLTLPLILPASVKAQNAKAVLDGVRTTNNTVLISTRNVRVLVSTISYSGAVTNVGLFTSSNVVLADNRIDKVVLYSTGSVHGLRLTVSSMTMATTPPNSQALCLASGVLGRCTDAVSSTGGCTCVAP